MKQYECKLISQQEVSKDIWRMRVYTPQIVEQSSAGQFLHIRVRDSIAPLLRRPFGIHRIHRESGELEILYRVVGEGTNIMKTILPGDTVDILGPLGNGFNLNGNFNTAMIVAGGMGIAPCFYLIDSLLELQKKVILFWGVKTSEEIFIDVEILKVKGLEVHIATEDGSMGHAGFITDPLSNYLNTCLQKDIMQGFACGPNPMLDSLQRITKNSAMDWEVSLEAHMACGVGVCMGCGVSHRDGGFRMVCSDGPVFKLTEVDLHE
ncbi:dihydroorotate dehydrogenase electron transfer subunit [bacterium]|nr:dihydroorotate dehydrogenase electron transfer subunit [bacterium]